MDQKESKDVEMQSTSSIAVTEAKNDKLEVETATNTEGMNSTNESRSTALSSGLGASPGTDDAIPLERK